ncbi:swi5-dependent recombination DNA repair protein 1 homolog [Osmerus eperlanus]|uniref:swi5-dependent recombination DNA repair protein 1 homolog n=1 Tax=Osmerus eperlanus TaxID=29151 RepID=UPI002E0E0869
METTPKTAKWKSVYGTPCYEEESSPCEVSMGKPKQQLSASLKARLKRSRRSFTSPMSVAKRLHIEDDDKNDVGQDKHVHVGIEESQDVHIGANISILGENDITSSMPESQRPTPGDPLRLIHQLKTEVKERAETLRRLKMVKMYRSKNDLTQLTRLIGKWRSCCQSAMYELQTDLPVDGKKASLAQLIDLFGLEDSILQFDRTEDDFRDA